MGYEKRQVNGRWTGLYELRPDVYRSAGTFASRREACDAWQEVERDLRRGTFIDPAKGRWPFRRYVEEVFLPLHTGVKINTLKNYQSDIQSQLMPFFGEMQLAEIYPQHVRRWIQEMTAQGLAPAMIRTRKATLSTILSRAVTDQYLAANHALHVRTPMEPPQRIRALTPTDVPRILNHLPGPVSTMLVELDTHTGLRWGEVTELGGRDVMDDEDDELRVYLWVTRAVVDAGASTPTTADASTSRTPPRAASTAGSVSRCG